MLDIIRFEREFQSANHYAWGWQDRANEANSEQAWQFGGVWAGYVQAYEEESMTHRMTMRDAWLEFERTGMLSFTGRGGGAWVVLPDAGPGVPRYFHLAPVPNVVGV